MDGTSSPACSLFVYSPVLAEVRSLAVHDRAKGGGWGSTLVKELIIEAQRRGVQTLFALTRAVQLFPAQRLSDQQSAALSGKSVARLQQLRR
jgi:N-acetylglutamate synthase-like GNAT family acetyltransferase